MLRFFLWVILAVPGMAALANTTWGPVSFIGPPIDFKRSPDNINPEATTLLRLSLEQPNITRSVSFKPFKNFTQIGTNDEAWSLRINISSFLASYAARVGSTGWSDIGPESHVVAASYDLSWPSGGNLSSILGPRTPENVCVTIPEVQNWPVNVTNTYSESASGSTSCEPVLGKACLEAIMARQMSISSKPTGKDECPKPGFWSELPECAGTFGYGGKASGPINTIDTVGIPPDAYKGNMSAPNHVNSSFDQPWTSGKGFYTEISEPVRGDKSAAYFEYSNRLRFIMLTAKLRHPGSGGYENVAELLCMRVNFTRLADNVKSGGNITTVKDAVLLPSGAGKVDLGLMMWLAIGTSIGVTLLTVG